MNRWVIMRVDVKDHKKMKAIYKKCKHSFSCSLHYFYQVAVSEYLERAEELDKFINIGLRSTDGE